MTNTYIADEKCLLIAYADRSPLYIAFLGLALAYCFVGIICSALVFEARVQPGRNQFQSHYK